MFKKIIAAAVTVLLSLVVNASAVSWDNGSGDRLWSTAANWYPNGVPDINTVISIDTAVPRPIINSPTAATGFQIRVGATGGANLTMNGGTINVNNNRFGIARNSAASVGRVYLYGGTINCLDCNMANIAGSTATMDITAGKMIIAGDFDKSGRVDSLDLAVFTGKLARNRNMTLK